ncbi:MAG TPA: RNA pyrophosphohydrolase [Gammaproteobacteria bacterium]|jgi:putative (di)nucleoside polyphosphate hydrolase
MGVQEQQEQAVIDAEGFRANVGIVLCHADGRLFWARRVGGRAGWQFPQGGMQPGETPEQALYRELAEEVGLGPEQVQVLATSRDWLSYRLPPRYQRHASQPVCIGQKQRWFLLRCRDEQPQVRFDTSPTPEFDDWRWVDYWHPLDEVIFFKRRVYREALLEFAPTLFPQGAPAAPPVQRARRRRGRR